jgi:hypothetical protein
MRLQEDKRTQLADQTRDPQEEIFVFYRRNEEWSGRALSLDQFEICVPCVTGNNYTLSPHL